MRGPQNDDTDGLEDLCVFVDLIDQLEAPAAYLSHGQTQWLEIALLMAQNAELILMDEPTAGMTAQETRKTAEIFNRLKGRHTLIVVEHDMGFVKEIGDVDFGYASRQVARGRHASADIETQPAVREAYLGSGGFGRCLRSTISAPSTAIAAPCRMLRWRLVTAASSACSDATASARPRCCAASSG